MKQLPAKAVRITPDDGQWFFGYYDIPAFDSTGSRHLAMRVNFWDRLPEKDDIAELYVIDLKTGEKEKFAETTAWCFQQGCFLQWLPNSEDTVIWNTRKNNACGYACVIKNLKTGKERTIDRPIANVSPTGKHALSINFDRMFDFRPGYGYAGRTDDWKNDNHPSNDGIYLIDLETGNFRLILSLQTLWDLTGGFFGGKDQKIMINHINFNTDGTRFAFLLRNFSNSGWKSAIITANTDGSDVFVLSDYAYASHYYWVSPSVIAFHSSGLELGDMGNQLYELTDQTHTGKAVDPSFFLFDGHISYSPNREYLLYDSYPKADGCRELYLYDAVTRRGGLLGRFRCASYPTIDIRCDLHPVWSPTGKMISIDSVYEGFRGMYTFDVTDAMHALRSEE
ncbi:MAG: hypothetical protein IJC48_02530 [Clostridia bacterium]|nr:hypothetical protein [Clostridia bacterium]